MNRALYPGSFDPFTNGHLSVLEKATKIFDEVIIAVSQNPSKKRRFDIITSEYCIIKTIEYMSMDKVKVLATSDPIPARIAKEYNCSYIVRGIRNNMDYNYEEGLAQFNKEVDKDIETIYFRADNTGISSTMVYAFMQEGINVDRYLPYKSDALLISNKNPGDISQLLENFYKYNEISNYVREYHNKVWKSK